MVRQLNSTSGCLTEKGLSEPVCLCRVSLNPLKILAVEEICISGENMIITLYKKEDFERLKKAYRRLDPEHYTVCVSPVGVVLVPTLSSKHLHVIIIDASAFKDLQDLEQFVKKLEQEKFVVLQPCNAKPEV